MRIPEPSLLALALSAGLCLSPSTAAQGGDKNLSILAPLSKQRADGPLNDAFDAARKAVVHVFVEIQGENDFKIERPSTGVVISGDGLVVTWWDLVREREGADDKRIFVQGAGESAERFEAEIVAKQPELGLALLRVQDVSGWDFLPLAEGSPGARCGVLSLHEGVDFIAFSGVVTPALGDVTVGADEDAIRLRRESLVLTDAGIQRRNHGAALIDEKGRLIGLCNGQRVQLPIREPKLEELMAPNFGFAVRSGVIREQFKRQLKGARVDDGVGSPSAIGRVAPMVVTVSQTGDVAIEGGDDPFARTRRGGVGSGVLIDPSGVILTNRHLLRAGVPTKVTFPGGEVVSASVLERGQRTNFALLKVEPRAVAEALAFRTTPVRPGETLYALGRPTGGPLSVAGGVLSADRGERLQTDAHLGNDNAGGAVVDASGQLVGFIDGGPVDRVVRAFRRRGEGAKVENSLNWTPGWRGLLRSFGDEANSVLDRAVESGGGSVDSSLAETLGALRPSLLNVYIDRVIQGEGVSDNPFAAVATRTQVVSVGSGVVVDSTGLALTNWHVVDAATNPDGSPRKDHVVRVINFDGEEFDVDVLSISREEDLALIRLDLEDGQRVRPVELGYGKALRVGDMTIAAGNPEGQANTVTVGGVSARDQKTRVKGRWAKLTDLFETDAAINGGNSGGGLLDAKGRLIGINSAGGSAFNTTGFSISVDRVRERLQNLLLTAYKMRSVYLGLEVEDRGGRLLVSGVDPSGPSGRAGVQPGDQLLRVGGEMIEWSVGWALSRLKLEDEPVDLVVRREGSEKTLSVSPLSWEVYCVQRQLSVECENFSIRTDPDLLRTAALAYYRDLVGDPKAEPRQYPGRLVRVKRVHSGKNQDALQPGDVLLGVTLERRIDSATEIRPIRFDSVDELRSFIQKNGEYEEGSFFKATILRDGKIERVDLHATRLLL